MDARRFLLTLFAMFSFGTTLLNTSLQAQLFVGPRSIVTSANFRVYARSAEMAKQVSNAAEANRKQLAVHWLGQEIPNWPQPCPLTVNDGNMLANGKTEYSLIPTGGVANFSMTVSGTPERILDSVLPHEITHTILASHFGVLGKPIPRWADEGACTTVEHNSERSKHDHMLVKYLSEGRGIPFATLFSLSDYPADIMPLYAQGYSVSCFLIAQGGPRVFVKFLERGMVTEDWVAAVDEYYQYPKIGKLKLAWERWVGDGGGAVTAYTADSLGMSTRTIASANNAVTAALANTTANNGAGRFINGSNGSNMDNGERLAETNRDGVRMASTAAEANSGSYYVEQLRRNQSTFVPAKPRIDSAIPGSIPYSVAQPAPFQTLGDLPGSGIRR
jgi:hypothetical protein